MKHLLLIACVAFAACAPHAPARPTPQVPSLRVIAGELRSVPKLEPDAVAKATSEITAALEDVYLRAFLAKPSLTDVFTQDAAASLATQPDAFRPDGPVARGTVRWSGIATSTDGTATSAWLQTTMDAIGNNADRLTQRGRVLLVRAPEGWRVAGFDVELTIKGRITSPRPVAARYAP